MADQASTSRIDVPTSAVKSNTSDIPILNKNARKSKMSAIKKVNKNEDNKIKLLKNHLIEYITGPTNNIDSLQIIISAKVTLVMLLFPKISKLTPKLILNPTY